MSVFLRFDRCTLLLTVLAVLGAILILAREATYGVGLQGDWATYISTARNLQAGKGFVQIYGWNYWHWPPLYPMLLAAVSLGIFDPYAVAGPLNAAVFGLTLFVAGQFLRWHVQQIFLIWACLAIMLALPLTAVASSAMAEAPFILFTTLSLVLISRYLDTGQRADLVWAAVFVSLAILTRYIGVTLIMTVLPLLLLRRGVGPWVQARHIGLYLMIATLPLALWLGRNFLVYGELHGPRRPSPYSLGEILSRFLDDMAEWVFLVDLPTGGALHVAATGFMALALLTLALAVGYIGVRVYRLDGDLTGRQYLFLVCGGFALVYLAFLTTVQTRTEILPLGGRYLSPVYLPLLFTAVLALDQFLGYEPPPHTHITGSGRLLANRQNIGAANRGGAVRWLTVVLALWLAVGAGQNALDIRRANVQGIGLTGPHWVHSEVVHYVQKELGTGAAVYSNDGRPLYIYAGPGDYRRLSRDPVKMRGQLENMADGAYIVWFHEYQHVASYHLQQLQEVPGLAPVAELFDGVIFQVDRAYDAGTARRTAYAALVSGVPVLRAAFDVHWDGHTLHYVKEGCGPADMALRFFLHLIPVDTHDLPYARRSHGFDNLDFDFARRGVHFDGRCWAKVQLPAYAIARIRTGQYLLGEGQAWHGEILFPEQGGGSMREEGAGLHKERPSPAWNS